jgi:hypothetical protein
MALPNGRQTAVSSPRQRKENKRTEGTPIDEYCEEHDLTISGRLQLFNRICSGVQYAQQRLVMFMMHTPQSLRGFWTPVPLRTTFFLYFASRRASKDEITLSNPGSLDVVAISLWENKANAEAYNTNTYPEVLKTFARMIDGTPKVSTFESVTSTFHNVAVAA